jgi:hypothetical protein
MDLPLQFQNTTVISPALASFERAQISWRDVVYTSHSSFMATAMRQLWILDLSQETK